MFCRPGGLRMKIQLPFISWIPELCHGCPLLKIFFQFAWIWPSLPFLIKLSALFLSFYLSSLLHKRRICIFQAMFYPLQEFTMSSRLKSLEAKLWRRKTFSSSLFGSIMLLSWVVCSTQTRCFSAGWQDGEKCSVWKKEVGYFAYDSIHCVTGGFDHNHLVAKNSVLSSLWPPCLLHLLCLSCLPGNQEISSFYTNDSVLPSSLG